ncbi:translation protein SH3-like domain-containing protein [Nemania sp. FL0916]|nr:translation protein SH3-like domain-containing protein [Nemania sp. FL0916]
MLAQSSRRPLGAWKSVLRRAYKIQTMPLPRTMATGTISNQATSSTEPPPPPAAAAAVTTAATATATAIPKPSRHKAYIYRLKGKEHYAAPERAAFAVYPRVPSARAKTPAVLDAYHAQQMRRLDPKGLRGQLFSRHNRDSARVGDVLQVTTRRGEPFAGVCMSIRRAGVDTAVLLRNRLTKVGVEMWFKVYSPTVVGIEIIWRRPKRARRARLTYMRQPKHDMGNVDHLVDAWRRSRNIFSSSKGKAKGKDAKKGAVAAKGGKR